MVEWRTVKVPQVGDVADHKSGELDPREVCKTKVIDGTLFVWLMAPGNTEIGPFDSGNYTYERKAE